MSHSVAAVDHNPIMLNQRYDFVPLCSWLVKRLIIHSSNQNGLSATFSNACVSVSHRTVTAATPGVDIIHQKFAGPHRF